MLNRILTVGITLFWAAMMTLLVQRDLIPQFQAMRRASQPDSYHYLERIAEKGRAEQMGIYLGDRRVGYTRSRVRMMADELHLESKTVIRLSEASGPLAQVPAVAGFLDFGIYFSAHGFQGELLDVRATLSMPPGTAPMVIVTGKPKGGALELTIRQGEKAETRTVDFDPKQLLSSSYGQAFSLPALKMGAAWRITVLDPLTRSIRVLPAKVVDREFVAIGGRTYDAYVIRILYGTSETKVWATPKGEILKQTMLGFTFLREDPPEDILEAPTL